MTIAYIDLDGVIADFVTGFNDQHPYELDSLSKPDLMALKKKFAEKEFFSNLPPFKGAKQFVKNVEKLGYEVQILTAVSQFDSEKNAKQKALWVKKHIGNYPFNWVRKAKDKAKYADGSKNILVDDRKKSTIPYEQAGGITIFHRDFTKTLSKLKKKLPLMEMKMKMKTYKELVLEGKKNSEDFQQRQDLKDAFYNASAAHEVLSALESSDASDLKSIKIDKKKETALWKKIVKLVDQSELGRYL